MRHPHALSGTGALQPAGALAALGATRGSTTGCLGVRGVRGAYSPSARTGRRSEGSGGGVVGMVRRAGCDAWPGSLCGRRRQVRPRGSGGGGGPHPRAGGIVRQLPHVRGRTPRTAPRGVADVPQGGCRARTAGAGVGSGESTIIMTPGRSSGGGLRGDGRADNEVVRRARRAGPLTRTISFQVHHRGAQLHQVHRPDRRHPLHRRRVGPGWRRAPGRGIRCGQRRPELQQMQEPDPASPPPSGSGPSRRTASDLPLPARRRSVSAAL